ncbi:hypothetical protein [Roseibacillus ishigakijimensis]|uniref:Uncharacterized protein n=1 Tax=Roseibacillus ishigakijimensis TaxID=454146 RepID=A0A934VI39_9BACT|nr:hypothetical protein [Roseibacillus ishigakijimensis]MBK1834663.1 hypothetical protein [Roseibacillus ishigakijimensis]
MKLHLVLFSLLFIGKAIEAEEAVIVGPLQDGSLPLPAPKLDLPPVEIKETKTHQLPDRTVTIHRIKDPSLFLEPEKKLENSEHSEVTADDSFQSAAVQERLASQSKTSHLFVSATVVDGHATFLQWWHDGEVYSAWSHADWMVLTSLTAFKKGDQQFSSLLMAGEMSSAHLAQDSPLRIPANLPTEVGSYRVEQGNLANKEAFVGIEALHEIYRNDYARLKAAYDLREQRRQAREDELAVRPSKPENITLHYWKVQPKKKGGGK